MLLEEVAEGVSPFNGVIDEEIPGFSKLDIFGLDSDSIRFTLNTLAKLNMLAYIPRSHPTHQEFEIPVTM